MFRNRAIQIRFAKDDTSTDDRPVTTIDVKQVVEVVQQNIAFTAVTVGFLYIGKKVVDTTSQIAIIAAEAKLK